MNQPIPLWNDSVKDRTRPRRTPSIFLPLLSIFALAIGAHAASTVKPGSDMTLVDTSASAGAVDLDLSSDAHATYGASGAFDGVRNGSNGRWLAVKAAHMFVTYRFNTPTVVNTIKLYNPDANLQDTRAPKNWTFEGSNDGETWTVLDTQTNQIAWEKGEVRVFWFENDAAYTYYKFDCTENNGAQDYLMLWEIEFCTASVPPPEDLTTANSGNVSSSSATHKDYPASRAFDNNRSNTNGRWLSERADNMYLVYHFKRATVVNAISVFNGSDAAGGYDSVGRSPKDWTFEGSNDGETWTVLDAQSGESGWASTGEERYYEFGNETAYEYYKFNCTSLNGGSSNYLQLWELEFYGEEPTPLTLAEELAAFLAPKGYTNVLEVALESTADWQVWLGPSSDGYGDFSTACAESPYSKVALVYKIQGNQYWYKQQLYYDDDGSDPWYFFESGNGANTIVDGSIYRLSNGAKQTTPYTFDDYYVAICDVPDLTNHTNLRGAFWNKAEFHLFVLHPNGLVFYGVKVQTPAPATLALGESAPFSTIVYDQITGREFPDIPVVYTPNANLSYANGAIRARATGTGTIEAKPGVAGEVSTYTAKVAVPMPRLGYYVPMASWEFDATVGGNWWLPLGVDPQDGLRTGLNYPMAVLKVEYDNNTSAAISSGFTLVLNNDRYGLADWETYPAQTHVTKWLGLADGIPELSTLVFNCAPNLHAGRITVYDLMESTIIYFR